MDKILAKKLNIFVIIYLADVFIYTKDPGQSPVNLVKWIFKKLRKNGLFANLKKCGFYKDKVCFLGYVVLAQGVQIKDKRIDVIKNWSKPKSVQDIQVFLSFANFYFRFI